MRIGIYHLLSFLIFLQKQFVFELQSIEYLMDLDNIEDQNTVSNITLQNSSNHSIPQNQNSIHVKQRAKQNKSHKVFFDPEGQKLATLLQFGKQVRKIKYVKQFIQNLKRTVIPSVSPYFQHQFALNQMPGRINTNNSDKDTKFWKNLKKSYEIIKFISFLIFFLTVSIQVAFFIEDKKIYTVFGVLCIIIEIVEIYINLKRDRKKCPKKSQSNPWMKWYLNILKQNFMWILLIIFTFVSVLIQQECLQILLSLLYLQKIIQCISQLKQVQNYIISSTNWQSYWNISKIILCNFFIAHCLSILLNLVTQIESNEQNWYLLKNLHDGSLWFQKYIWGCYWGTTIMLTIGFGDISASNLSEAVCLIFLMTFSCIILAYNIAEVSKILSKMGQIQLQKNKKLKILYNLSNNHKLSEELHSNLKNSIEKSFELKKQFNFQEQQELLASLPQKLEKQVGRQVNKRIFGTLTFFKDLTQNCQIKIAQCITKFMAHPDQVLLKKGDIWKLYIIKKGTLCLTYRQDRSILNGTSIDTFENLGQSANKLVSLSFIKKKRILGDLKSLTFSLLLSVQNEKLEQILKNKDQIMYEYYCVERDRDYKQEAELHLCAQCQQDKHSQIFCPKLHYCPLKEHLIKKNLRSSNNLRHSSEQQRGLFRRKKKSDFETLKNYTFVEQNILCKIISEDEAQNSPVSKLYDDTKLALSFQQNNGQNYNAKLDIIQKSINKILDYLTDDSKNLQVDQAMNYKGYFPKFNPQNLYKITTINNIRSKIVKKKFTRFNMSNHFSSV